MYDFTFGTSCFNSQSRGIKCTNGITDLALWYHSIDASGLWDKLHTTANQFTRERFSMNTDVFANCTFFFYNWRTSLNVWFIFFPLLPVYKKSLGDDISSETSGDFRKALLTLADVRGHPTANIRLHKNNFKLTWKWVTYILIVLSYVFMGHLAWYRRWFTYFEWFKDLIS